MATSRARSSWSVLNHAEQERASERGWDGGGGSWAGRQPLLSASIRKPRGDMGAGQDTRNSGEGGGGGRRGRDGETVPSMSFPGPQVHPASPPLLPLSICFGCRCVTLQLGHGVAGRPGGSGIAGFMLSFIHREGTGTHGNNKMHNNTFFLRSIRA